MNFIFPKLYRYASNFDEVKVYRRAGSENKNTKLASYLIAYKADRMISM